MRSIGILVLCVLFFAKANAQNPVPKKPLDTTIKPLDTAKKAKDTSAYVNQGKIAGKKAFIRSLIFPGLGQMYNYGLVVDDVKSGRAEGSKFWQKTYIVGKIAGIYAGGTLLAISYGENRKNYKKFLTELQYRAVHKDKPDPDGGLSAYTNTSALLTAKNIYKRNSQVVILSMVGLYGLNALDAYITARLKYFNIDDSLALKLSPGLINSNTMYGYNSAVPALKITLKL